MKKKLNANNFKRQMLENGYLYEQLPPCFTTQTFAEKVDEVFEVVKGKKYVTTPTTISMYKNDGTRRIVSIPNPLSFASAVHVFSSNWTICRKFADSSNSQSNITFILEYEDSAGRKIEREFINSERQRDRLGVVSHFLHNLRERIIVSLGRPYKLSLDIATFYDSIYTHSLTWSMCGKEPAKRWHSLVVNKEDKKHKELKPQYYDQADKLDCAIRRMKGNETNGIVTGPFLSRIFSEILLCGIDGILRKRAGLVFKRYVDDYSFYFHSETEAERGITSIESVLHGFGLNLNPAKTKIERYPFDIADDLYKRLKIAYEGEGVYGLLSEASRADIEGSKGAFKYGLKMLQRKVDPKKEDPIDIPILMNIGISRPSCSLLVFIYLKKRKETLDINQVGATLNDMIAGAVEDGLEQEALNALYYCRELEIHLTSCNVVEVLKKGNDLCCLIALDYVHNRNDSIDYQAGGAGDIDLAEAELSQRLKGETTDGSHWLLIYESLNHGFLDVSLGEGVTAEAMRQLALLGVSFYEGFADPNFEWATEATTNEQQPDSLIA